MLDVYAVLEAFVHSIQHLESESFIRRDADESHSVQQHRSYIHLLIALTVTLPVLIFIIFGLVFVYSTRRNKRNCRRQSCSSHLKQLQLFQTNPNDVFQASKNVCDGTAEARPASPWSARVMDISRQTIRLSRAEFGQDPEGRIIASEIPFPSRARVASYWSRSSTLVAERGSLDRESMRFSKIKFAP